MTTYRVQCPQHRSHPFESADFQAAQNETEAHNLVHHSGARVARAETKRCLCRCGSGVSKNYRAGHDARHVSLLVQAFEAKMDKVPDYERSTLYKNCIDQLPTEPLKAKFRRRIARLAFTKYARAVQSMTLPDTDDNRWFNRSLVGLMTRYPDPTYVEAERAVTLGLLAATGWDRRSIGQRLS